MNISVTRACSSAVLVLAACGSGGNRTGVQVERRVVADTTLVRTLAGSAWGDSAALVEDLAIGVLDGPEEYQLGSIYEIAVDATGGIYTFDAQVPVLRYYDSSGTHRRTIGRKGAGPSEYQNASLGMVIRHSDGRLIMLDPRNTRLNVYTADGSPSESWRVPSGLYTPHSPTIDEADHVYLKFMVGQPEPNEPWPSAVLHLDDRGRMIDTLRPPAVPDEPAKAAGAFGASKVWDFSPSGGFVVALTDRYRVEHHRPDGSVLRIERNVPPVSMVPGEKAEWEAYYDWVWKAQGQSITSERKPIPDVKPFLRDVVTGDDGRIWVRRYVVAEKGEDIRRLVRPGQEPPPPRTWHEPTVYDVFETDGTFLGSLRVPAKTNIMVTRGDLAWGTRTGASEETYVVRLRIVRKRG